MAVAASAVAYPRFECLWHRR